MRNLKRKRKERKKNNISKQSCVKTDTLRIKKIEHLTDFRIEIGILLLKTVDQTDFYWTHHHICKHPTLVVCEEYFLSNLVSYCVQHQLHIFSQGKQQQILF